MAVNLTANTVSGKRLKKRKQGKAQEPQTAERENWLDAAPEAKASVLRGIADIEVGRIRKRASYAHLTKQV
jgi:hypothetical protein